MVIPSKPKSEISNQEAESESPFSDVGFGISDLNHSSLQVILSIDVEEHFRIEAAAGLDVGPGLQVYYRGRLEPSTRWLLDQFADKGIKATFFVVGEITQHSPGLIRAIHAAGHEVASHGWEHRRLHQLTPEAFRQDLRKSKDALEQVAGTAVVGYRAPTFSITRQTAWAIDILSEEGFLYDSSIYPVRHDRYGVPAAPRLPFWVRGASGKMLEIPPATLRIFRTKFPAGGGGYFRLLPLSVVLRALEQVRRECRPAVAMLYFHPWEFDQAQARLPLGRLGRFRTYVGIGRSRDRFGRLLERYDFARAVDVVRGLEAAPETMPTFDLMA